MGTLKEFLKEIDGNESEIMNYEGDEALEKVKLSGYFLKYINSENQTEEMCLIAVKEEGNALQYVHNKTEEICLIAVKKEGCALAYMNIENQTEEICLEAVKHNGFALQYVYNQTEEICLLAVSKYKNALQYVDKSVFKEENIEYTMDELEKIVGNKFKLIK